MDQPATNRRDPTRRLTPTGLTRLDKFRFYRSLSQDFELSIDALGPNFGDEALMDALAGSGSLATLVGTDDRYLWPDSYDLRRIPVHEPTPVYPHVLLTRATHQHPVLSDLREYLRASRPQVDDEVWVPGWVTH